VTALARVSVVIVSYQVRGLLERCLESLRAQTGIEPEVWVVDNASPDGSADLVEARFPEARLLRNRENLGFARANNQALERAGGEVLVLLNPDTEVPPGTLAAIVEVFRRHPRAGCVGLGLVQPDGRTQPSCHAFPGILNTLLESFALHRLALRLGIGTPWAAPVPKGGEGPVDWVAGACMAISREAYRGVGGLNEALFMYGEEMDWSWRARARGFETVHAATPRVLHHGGASGESLRGPLFVKNLESRITFLRRYRGAWRAGVAREILTVGSALRLVLWGAIAALDRIAGRERPHTRTQLERFGAVVRWRLGRPA
jgi:GT2 family glycosyltransferase